MDEVVGGDRVGALFNGAVRGGDGDGEISDEEIDQMTALADGPRGALQWASRPADVHPSPLRVGGRKAFG